MSLYDDFESDDNVNMPRRDYTDIVRQDSSVELRNRFRSFWQAGEHLWDVDYNNNIGMLGWWAAPEVHRWRLPAAPWTNDSLNTRSIHRTGTYQNFLVAMASAQMSAFVPFAGAKVYSRADRLFIAYTGSDWKPMFYHYHYKPEIEIAMFAHYPRRAAICARHIATEKFELTNEGAGGISPFSRVRANTDAEFAILKNGVAIGEGQYRVSNVVVPQGRVILANPVTFEVGDELTIRAPSPLEGVLWLSVSFIGRVIEE